MFPSPHPPTPFVSRHERFLFPENDYADWKVQASGRGEIARSTMARERESERKEPEIIFLEFFSYLNSLHRSSLEINVQSTIRWNDFCEKILWLWDGLTDKRWRYIYIYIYTIVGSSKNSKRSIISAASGSTGLFYFLANDPDFRRSKFRNCYGIQAARPRFLETKISSPVSSFYSFFFEGKIRLFVHRGEEAFFWEARISRVFSVATHSCVVGAAM